MTLLLGWSGRTNHGVLVVIVHRLSSVRIHMCIVNMIYVRSSAGDMQIRESTEAGGPIEAGGPLLYFLVFLFFAVCAYEQRLLVQSPPRRVAGSPDSTEAGGMQPRVHRCDWHAAPESTEAGGTQLQRPPRRVARSSRDHRGGWPHRGRWVHTFIYLCIVIFHLSL